MSLTVSLKHDSLVLTTVHLTGAILAATTPILAEALKSKFENRKCSLVFDLAHVSMNDSTGLCLIATTKKQQAKENLGFGIIHAQPTVLKVFEIVKLTSHLNVFASQVELDSYLIGIQQKMMAEGEENSA